MSPVEAAGQGLLGRPSELYESSRAGPAEEAECALCRQPGRAYWGG